MLKVRFLFILISAQILCLNNVVSQNAVTVIKTDFAVRDFNVLGDSIYYLKKRNAYFHDMKTNVSKNHFIGGYGLKIENVKNTNTIVFASNELVDTVSSVRVFNKMKNTFDAVFFHKNAKILDLAVIPESELFALSSTDKKIVFVDYSDSPNFQKIIEIELDSLSRKLICDGNLLYFATDNGEIYQYNFLDYSKLLLHKGNELITEFVLTEKSIIYTTIKGNIVKISRENGTKSLLSIENNFISTITRFNLDKLICGSWSGMIYILSIDEFSIEKELKIHDRSVLKIKKDNNIIYSSSLDKTIRKWNLNLHMN